MELERTTHNINEVNKHVRLVNVNTIITFRTQQLLDLWINEMVGQISDGMWENSSNTEWLWRNVYLKLGDKTSVINCQPYARKRTSFPLGKSLWDVVGDRIMIENGFNSKAEAKAAWTEIATAIASWTTDGIAMEEIRKMGRDVEKAVSVRMKAELEAAIPEVEKMVEDGKRGVSRYSSGIGFMADKKFYSVSYLTNGDKGFWGFENPVKFRVPEGELLPGLEKLRTFVQGVQELGGYV